MFSAELSMISSSSKLVAATPVLGPGEPTNDFYFSCSLLFLILHGGCLIWFELCRLMLYALCSCSGSVHGVFCKVPTIDAVFTYLSLECFDLVM
jgi:hypothetical protein